MKRFIAILLACMMIIPAMVGCDRNNNIEDTPQVMNDIIADDAVQMLDAETERWEEHIYASEYAFTRDGDEWANLNWREIIRKRGLNQNNNEVLVFKHTSKGYNREVYFTFDISSLKGTNYNFVFFRPSFAQLAADTVVSYKIYLVDADSWSSNELTYNTAPQRGELIAEDCLGANMTGVDLTAAVDKLIAAGEDKLSIVMVADKGSYQGESRISPKATTLVATNADTISSYVKNLVPDEAENKAIWDWAQQVYDEWYVRYEYLVEKGIEEVDPIPVDQNEYAKTVITTGSGITSYNTETLETKKWTEADFDRREPTRTVDSLIGLGIYSNFDVEQEFDIYGGLIDEQMRQEATGFFYSKKIGDRWWIIDPLGYPCYIRSVSGVAINYLSSPNQKNAALEKYGTSEKWGIAATRQLKDDWGFNASTGNGADISSVENRLIYQGGIGFVGSYGSQIGTNNSTGGSTTFTTGTMNVFDPAFVDWCDEKAQAAVGAKDDEWLLGRTMDNELPMSVNMLNSYLHLDPTDPVHHYSYACAWTWLKNMTGKENPTGDDITDELLQIFVGFVYDRFYSLATTAIRKYDPNHMILGSRLLDGVINIPWVLRFAGLHLDCLTINWYGEWDIPVEELKSISENANIPLMVTEFYVKGMDSGLDNTRGAGWVVKTQAERGDFYQCYTLRLLECKNFVGWHWFQYIDNDPDPKVIYTTKDGKKAWRDQSSIDANKGIISNTHEPYTDLAEAMAEINNNVYRLIDHFDSKYSD